MIVCAGHGNPSQLSWATIAAESSQTFSRLISPPRNSWINFLRSRRETEGAAASIGSTCRHNWFSVADGGLQVGVSARLNAFRLARCGRLSGEYSPVFRQARFDSGRRRRLAVASRFLGQLHAGAQAKFGVDVGEVGLHSAR